MRRMMLYLLLSERSIADVKLLNLKSCKYHLCWSHVIAVWTKEDDRYSLLLKYCEHRLSLMIRSIVPHDHSI